MSRPKTSVLLLMGALAGEAFATPATITEKALAAQDAYAAALPEIRSCYGYLKRISPDVILHKVGERLEVLKTEIEAQQIIADTKADELQKLMLTAKVDAEAALKRQQVTNDEQMLRETGKRGSATGDAMQPVVVAGFTAAEKIAISAGQGERETNDLLRMISKIPPIEPYQGTLVNPMLQEINATIENLRREQSQILEQANKACGKSQDAWASVKRPYDELAKTFMASSTDADALKKIMGQLSAQGFDGIPSQTVVDAQPQAPQGDNAETSSKGGAFFGSGVPTALVTGFGSAGIAGVVGYGMGNKQSGQEEDQRREESKGDDKDKNDDGKKKHDKKDEKTKTKVADDNEEVDSGFR